MYVDARRFVAANVDGQDLGPRHDEPSPHPPRSLARHGSMDPWIGDVVSPEVVSGKK